MPCYLTKRWGESVDNPTISDLQSALAELEVDDPEHPDCWLQDQTSWAISAFGSGLIILENAETNEGPWHMRGASRQQVLELWGLLQSNRLDLIRKRDWQPGYGPPTK
jgi:hypothetical protein